MTGGPPLAAWGLSVALRPLEGGHRNRVLIAEGHGPPLVFKTTRHGEAALRWLEPVYAAAEAAGCRTAAFWPTSAGRLSAAGWTCETYLPGRPVPVTDLPRLAAPMARFHRLTAGIDQRPGMVAAADLTADDRLGDVPLAEMPPALVRACLAAWAPLAGLPRRAVHGDLNTGNLLFDEQDRPILFDWEEARVDCPLFDQEPLAVPGASGSLARRARQAWEILSAWRVEPDYARALAHRFLGRRPPGPHA